MRLFYSVLIVLFILLPLQATDFGAVDRVIEQAIADSLFPGAQIAIGTEDSVFYSRSYGHFTYEPHSPEVSAQTKYDLASVTKAFATNLVIMQLYEQGRIRLEDPVAKYISTWQEGDKAKVTIRDLLIHESGLPAYYTPPAGITRAALLDSLRSLKLVYPTNTKTVYSCVNFITLMLISEQILNKPMQNYYQENIARPLGLTQTFFTPPDDRLGECAPTRADRQGVVHDPLACALNGLSGNAGLFSNAEDLSVLARMLLHEGSWNGTQIFKPETVQLFRRRQSEKSTRALGFDTRSEQGASSGDFFSMETYGHLGFTGTSIWIDPVKKVFVVFLSNRVYPDEQVSVSQFRPLLHNTVMEVLGMADRKKAVLSKEHSD